MKFCRHCLQFIKLENKRYRTSPQIRKLLQIMLIKELTPLDVANICGISKRTIYRWLEQKDPEIKPQYFKLLEIFNKD